MDTPTPSQWNARCAARLGERWRTAHLAELEAAAVELWRSERLRELVPEDAARLWLAPLTEAQPPADRLR